MEDQGGPLSGVGQISVTVHDLEEAVAFYRDSLGLPELFRAGTMAFLQCGDVRLMLTLPEEVDGDARASILYFRVEDLEAAHARLRERGVPFERPPHKVADLGERELWMAFFRDPDGQLMAIMSERPPEA